MQSDVIWAKQHLEQSMLSFLVGLTTVMLFSQVSLLETCEKKDVRPRQLIQATMLLPEFYLRPTELTTLLQC